MVKFCNNFDIKVEMTMGRDEKGISIPVFVPVFVRDINFYFCYGDDKNSLSLSYEEKFFLSREKKSLLHIF